MTMPSTESVRKETPHTLHANLISIDSFWSPERQLASQDTKKYHPGPAGQREHAVLGWMMVIPPGASN
jgi:hypothetical protein